VTASRTSTGEHIAVNEQFRDGEVVEWRMLDEGGNPVGDPLVIRYTNQGKVVDRPSSESGKYLSTRRDTPPMDMIAPTNPLKEILGRLLPLAERWLEKQVGEKVQVAGIEPTLTPKEAAPLLHLHVQTMMAWCRKGKLGAVKIGANKLNGKGGKYLIPRKAIDDYLREQRVLHGERRRKAK
jgi:excisionase family DNA binding protein